MKYRLPVKYKSKKHPKWENLSLFLIVGGFLALLIMVAIISPSEYDRGNPELFERYLQHPHYSLLPFLFIAIGVIVKWANAKTIFLNIIFTKHSVILAYNTYQLQINLEELEKVVIWEKKDETLIDIRASPQKVPLLKAEEDLNSSELTSLFAHYQKNNIPVVFERSY